jgi:hypothetical protein
VTEASEVDYLPWWADTSDNNTIDLAGMPPGQHKVLIELVDADHKVFPDESRRQSSPCRGRRPIRSDVLRTKAASVVALATSPDPKGQHDA